MCYEFNPSESHYVLRRSSFQGDVAPCVNDHYTQNWQRFTGCKPEVILQQLTLYLVSSSSSKIADVSFVENVLELRSLEQKIKI